MQWKVVRQMESVLYEIRDKVAYVTINRPEAYNACDQPTYDRLAEVWKDFSTNDELGLQS